MNISKSHRIRLRQIMNNTNCPTASNKYKVYIRLDSVEIVPATQFVLLLMSQLQLRKWTKPLKTLKLISCRKRSKCWNRRIRLFIKKTDFSKPTILYLKRTSKNYAAKYSLFKKQPPLINKTSKQFHHYAIFNPKFTTFWRGQRGCFPLLRPFHKKQSLSNFCPKKIVADGEGASAQNLIVCVLL